MPTAPWTAGEIANAISGRTAIDFRINRGPSVNPIAFCCGSNTISDSKNPSCLLSVNVQVGHTDTIFSFDGSGSFAPDGTIVSWDWAFGDGDVAATAAATHRYDEGGDYEAVLTIVDALGLVRNCAVGITVDDGQFPPFNGESRRAWVGQLGQASYCLDLYGANPNMPSSPVWATVTDGLPAGARVNDISINPRDRNEVIAACGDPNHAVNGGVFRCPTWGAAFVDITPPNPGTWWDGDDNVGGEVNKDTAAIIALSDAEWDAANWIFCEADRRWDGNVHAIALVHKAAPSTVIGTFYCIYHAATATWEVTQLWTNKNQPWYCMAKRAAISWVGGQYIYVVTDGTNLSWSNGWGRGGSWQDTAALPVGYTPWNDEGLFEGYRGAVWTEYQEWDALDPFDWPSSDEVFLSVNEWPHILKGDAGGLVMDWEAWGFTSSEAVFRPYLWGAPHWGYTNRMGDVLDDPGGMVMAVDRGPRQWANLILGTGERQPFSGNRYHTFWRVPNSSSLLLGWCYTKGAGGSEWDAIVTWDGHVFHFEEFYRTLSPAFPEENDAYDTALMEFFAPTFLEPAVTRTVLLALEGVNNRYVEQTTVRPWLAGGVGGITAPYLRRFNSDRSGNLAMACYSVDVDLWS